MANQLIYRYAGLPAFRCDGCDTIHSDEGKALRCCNSPVTECGVTELGPQPDGEVDIGMVPCWYLEEAGQLRLF